MEFELASSSSSGDVSNERTTIQDYRTFTELVKDKLDSAGRELRRRLPMAGQLGAHLIHPRRLLLNSTRTEPCDVVITFAKGVPDSTLLWILRKLRSSQPRLRVYVRHHVTTKCSAFYITAEDEMLLELAEEIHMMKLLKPEFGGGYKEFIVRDAHCFNNGECTSTLFNSQERARLVRHSLESARATQNDTNDSIILKPGQSIIPACISKGVISAMFPLHDRTVLDQLRQKWVKTLFNAQPLDEISSYFGVKIALYFAWLEHYTNALTVPAIVGLVFWIWLGTANESSKDIAHVLFSMFNVLWACVYLETWKRYSNVLAYKWGTLDQRDDLLMVPRPQFQGELVISPVTGRLETEYPMWKRRLFRFGVSYPLTFIFLIVSAMTTFVLLQTKDWWESKIGYFSWIPASVLGCMIFLQEVLYSCLAKWLNNKENYRLENSYENHLIVKIVLFQFVNSFMSLFYIAFYINDMEKLKEQLAVLLITRQIIRNIRESAVPYLIENVRLARICVEVFGSLSPTKAVNIAESVQRLKESGDTSEEQKMKVGNDSVDPHIINQAELESQLFEYEGTMSEYMEMLTQLGHVMLFSSAFPLAAACALVNNILEIRADAFKLCHIARRPFPQSVKSIGGWEYAMECMVFVAVIVNCALIGQSGIVHRMFPEWTTLNRIIFIVAFEHLILVVLLAVRMAVPTVPGWLATQMAKVEFARREAIKNSHSNITGSIRTSDEDLFSRNLTPQSPALKTPTMSTADKKKLVTSIGKIADIPPFKPRVTPTDEKVETSSSPTAQRDLSPVKPRKESHLLLLSTTRGLRNDEPLHKSAHCLPQQTPVLALQNQLQKELASSIIPGGSEPDLNSTAPTSDTTPASDDEKRKGVSRARAALVKRARSVAVFSLRLKKAREAAAAKEQLPVDTKPHSPQPSYGGELSLIPIEKLIQMDDVRKE